MSDEDKMNTLNNLWQNYAISKTFEPGSTFKPFTEAMGLDSGTLHGDETYICDGGEWVSGHEIGCVKRTGHGTEDLRGALRDSCNDAMMQMVRSIGPANFAKYSREYGFGQKTGIDLPGEAGTIMHQQKNVGPVELATISFGQSFQLTPMQMATTVSSLINGGKRICPHIADITRTFISGRRRGNREKRAGRRFCRGWKNSYFADASAWQWQVHCIFYRICAGGRSAGSGDCNYP